MLNVIEDVRNEFKVKLTDKFEEEVISFLNSSGGNIYIGVNDKGDIIGINGNIDLLQRTIKDRIKDNIMPSTLGLYDVVVMEESKAKMFVNSPNAIDGNYEEKLDTAAAKFQSEAGNVDIVCDEASVYENVRALVSMLPSNNEDGDMVDECDDDLNRACAEIANCVGDTSKVFLKILLKCSLLG